MPRFSRDDFCPAIHTKKENACVMQPIGSFINAHIVQSHPVIHPPPTHPPPPLSTAPLPILHVVSSQYLFFLPPVKSCLSLQVFCMFLALTTSQFECENRG